MLGEQVKLSDDRISWPARGPTPWPLSERWNSPISLRKIGVAEPGSNRERRILITSPDPVLGLDHGGGPLPAACPAVRPRPGSPFLLEARRRGRGSPPSLPLPPIGDHHASPGWRFCFARPEGPPTALCRLPRLRRFPPNQSFIRLSTFHIFPSPLARLDCMSPRAFHPHSSPPCADFSL